MKVFKICGKKPRYGLMDDDYNIVLSPIYEWIEVSSPGQIRIVKYSKEAFYMVSYEGDFMAGYYYFIGEKEKDGLRIVLRNRHWDDFLLYNLISEDGKIKYTNWHLFIGRMQKNGKRVLRG